MPALVHNPTCVSPIVAGFAPQEAQNFPRETMRLALASAATLTRALVRYGISIVVGSSGVASP